MEHCNVNPFCYLLPLEIVGHVFSFADIENVYNFSYTCKDNYRLVKSIINTEYFVHMILERGFKKKSLSISLRNFINKITENKQWKWMRIFSSLYKRNIIPQREIMLPWKNYDTLIDAIIYNMTPVLNYMFVTYKLDAWFLSDIIKQLRYNGNNYCIKLLIREARRWNICIDYNYPDRFTKYYYGYNIEICDIQINIYALPFILKKRNTGNFLLELLKKRVGSENMFHYTQEIFTIWVHDGYRYVGNINSLILSS